MESDHFSHAGYSSDNYLVNPVNTVGKLYYRVYANSHYLSEYNNGAGFFGRDYLGNDAIPLRRIFQAFSSIFYAFRFIDVHMRKEKMIL